MVGSGLYLILTALLMAGCATTSSSSHKAKPVTKEEHARMLVEVANGSLVEGDATSALEMLLRAEKEDPDLPELYHSKALVYYAKHDLQTALSEIKKALKIMPDYPDANNTYGRLLLDTGDYEDAVAPLLKAAQNPLYRDAMRPYTNLGILYYRRGKFTESEKYLRMATRDAPIGGCVAYYYLGHLRLKQANYREAIRFYDLASKKICANFSEAHLALGLAYEQSKQYEMARKTFLEIEQRYPNTKIADEAVTHLRYLP